MIAKYYLNDTVSNVPITTGGTEIPTGSAYMLTGTYIYNGVSYDCSQEGLYRFFNESNGNVLNKIACADWTGGSNLYGVISGISNNHLHGTDDNSTNYQTVSNAGKYRKWRSQCGYISGMCNWLMPQLGFTSRVVNVTTLGPFNGWDDGHIVFETLHGPDWRMWDITNGCYFVDSGNNHMSTDDFIAQIANNGSFPNKVKLDGDIKFNSDSIYGIDLQIYGEFFHDTEAKRESWYRRIFQDIV